MSSVVKKIPIRSCDNCIYTKTGLVFGFIKNQSLVAVILGQNCFWIIAEHHFEMSIHSTNAKENEVSGVF